MNMGSSDSLILGSNLVSFLPGISAQERQRILDCLLFCEFYAAKAVPDKKKEWERWIGMYQRMLPVTGFIQATALDAPSVKVSNKKEFGRESVKLVSRISSRGLASAAEGALDDMLKSPHAQSFFSSWLKFDTGRSDSFQVIPCMKNRAGHIEIAVCGLQMITRTRLKKIPTGLWPFTYEMTITVRGGVYAFDRTNYDVNRERIEQELVEGGARITERIDL